MCRPKDHIPVLLGQVLAGLQVEPGGRYIDATLGAGGHAAAILRASAPTGQLLGIDADPEAVFVSQRALQPFGERATFHCGNFRDLRRIASSLGFESADGVLLDLGLSSRQLAEAKRGFSFSEDGPLDMRFNQSHGQRAADLVNHLPETELAQVLREYGEDRYAHRIASAIVAARPVTTTSQLADLIARTVGRREKIHPATRTFQALRIAVNDELEALTQALPQARDLLAHGGRVAVIAFHSLEDRIVKRFFQSEARDCVCPPEAPICVCQHLATLRIISRKPITPNGREITDNPRSRSGKLRIAERLSG